MHQHAQGGGLAGGDPNPNRRSPDPADRQLTPPPHSAQDAFFRKQERARLDRLKAKRAQEAKPILEDDENARLAKILDTVIATDGTKGVRAEIREALKVQLLLWKHDEDTAKK